MIDHEVAITVIRDRDGAYFIHQRRPDRRVFPSRWGVGAGGKLEPDESPASAAARELLEEAGVVAEPSFLFSMQYSETGLRSRMHVFETVTDREAVGFDEREWSAVRWVGEDDLRMLAYTTADLCPDTAAFVKRMFLADS